MKHALIIEDNMLVSRALEDRLVPLGFASFDHVWTEEDAVAVADRRFPDLIIVGDHVTAGCGINAARRICSVRDVPVLLVTANGGPRRRPHPDVASIEGPFSFRELDTFVDTIVSQGAIAA